MKKILSFVFAILLVVNSSFTIYVCADDNGINGKVSNNISYQEKKEKSSSIPISEINVGINDVQGVPLENDNTPYLKEQSLFSTLQKYVLEEGECGDNATYVLYDDNSLYISGSGSVTKKWDPATVKTLIVNDGITSINLCDFDFQTSILESIFLGKNVSSIGDFTYGIYLFNLIDISVDENNNNFCSKESVLYNKDMTTLLIYPAKKDDAKFVVPNSVTKIDAYSFYQNENIEEIEFSNNLTEIGYSAFAHCSSLKSLVIPDSVTKIGGDCFHACTSLTDARLSNKMKKIDANLFDGCTSLKTVYIPDSITEISTYAFYKCISLKKIFIPSSVNVITNAFYSCTPFLTIYTNKSTEPTGWNSRWNSFGYGSNEKLIVVYNTSRDDYDKTSDDFNYVENISGYKLSLTNNKLTITGVGGTISSWVLEKFNSNYSKYVEEIVFGEKITGIELSIIPISSFSTDGSYKATKKVYISKDIATIHKDAFTNNYSLIDIEVDNANANFCSINGVLYSKDCSKLLQCPQGKMGEIAVSEKTNEICSNSFYSCKGITSITIPKSVTSIDDNAFERCGLSSITFTNSTTKIGKSAFYGCSNLQYINFSDSIQSIESSAFNGCSKLKSLVIPNSVTSIGYSAFKGCSSLESLTISNSVDIINESTFESCSALKSLSIPDSVVSIEQNAFYGCSALKSISIPDSVVSIKNNAFSNCESLESLYIPSSVTSIHETSFRNLSSLSSIIVDSNNSIYNSRSNSNAIITNTNKLILGCKNTTIPNSVTSIGNYAFYGCKFSEIVIPNSVTSIGNYAFSNCSLSSIVLPSSVKTIGNNAFSSCSELLKVYIPKTIESIYSSGYSFSVFYWCKRNMIIYTDVFDEDSVPNGWQDYWNYYSKDEKIEVKYNQTLEDFYGHSYEELTALICSANEIVNNLDTVPYTNPSVELLKLEISKAEKVDPDDLLVVNDCYSSLRIAIENLKVPTITVVLTSNPNNSGILSGGGFYTAAETVKLTAKTVGGYTFNGWYINDELVSDSPIHSFVLPEVTGNYYIEARYYPNESKVVNVNVGRGVVDYSYMSNEGKMFNDTSDFKVPKGTELSLTAVPLSGATFLYWIDINTKRILTEKTTYKFNVRETADLMACYMVHFDGYHYVIFKDMNGKVLSSVDVKDGEPANAPDHGYFTGYTFTGWDSDFSNITEDMVITALYEKESGYTLTVINGEVINPKDSYSYDDKVEVKTEQMKDGKYFSGWYVGEQKVSTQLEYSFYILGNTIVTAKFEGDSPIIDEPIVTLTVNDRMKVSDVKETVQIVVERHIPSAYTFNEVGFLLTLVDSKATSDNMLITSQDNDILHYVSSTSTKPNGTYDHTIGLSEVSKMKNVWVRGYLTYADKSTGVLTTIYTDIKVSTPHE